jgi:bifunctional DNA-binding transcriptional regulator/antitoxin component of YhaV-PrlF toxin-antitoxin module
MTTLTITAKGQVTFRKAVLRHLGLRPGDKVEIDLLPGGQASLRAARAPGAFADARGMLKGKTNGRTLTIAELNAAIAEAGAAAGLRGAETP